MSNDLARGIYNGFNGLTAMQHRVLGTAISQIDHWSPKSGDLVAEVNLTELAHNCRVPATQIYSQAREAARGLRNRSLSFIDPNDPDTEVLTGWFTKVRMNKGSGTMHCYMAPELKPYLTAIREHRTELELSSFLKLGRSPHTYRLYELLCSWRSRGTWVRSLDQFRADMGVGAGEYSRLFDFKRTLLDQPLAIINKKSDIKASYEKDNRGRKWTHLKFTILPNKHGEPEQAEKVPDWEDWWDERCETESGQDTIWRTAYALGLVCLLYTSPSPRD